MENIIFYGAGQNAHDKWNKWREQGITPVCIADMDVQKQHTLFEGETEILSLFEAVSRYPDYMIYCTQMPSNLGKVYNYLRGLGIPENKIGFLEEYKGGGGANGLSYQNDLYPRLYQIYQTLQDDLSKTLFWGRVECSLSHNISGIYRAMICHDNMEWLKGKRTYAEIRYGLSGLWELLEENYPKQKHKLYLLGVDDEWNEYGWVVDRFLSAVNQMGIHIEGCIMPYNKEKEQYMGIPCMPENEFLQQIDGETRIIIGFPGWCLETKKIVERYAKYKDILYPIADTAHPQYIEEFFVPEENEIYVDVGVYDFQNSIDFTKWAKKGWEKIYAFEPNPGQYQKSLAVLNSLGNEFAGKVELVNKGLSSQNGVLEFPEEYKGSGMVGENTIWVDVVSLDSFLKGEKVTYVKMDVEGAEMDVLLGMRETILKYKPKMAVCIYHKYQDIFEIASFLLELVPEYKFYIRHYNSNETENVLFCKI